VIEKIPYALAVPFPLNFAREAGAAAAVGGRFALAFVLLAGGRGCGADRAPAGCGAAARALGTGRGAAERALAPRTPVMTPCAPATSWSSWSRSTQHGSRSQRSAATELIATAEPGSTTIAKVWQRSSPQQRALHHAQLAFGGIAIQRYDEQHVGSRCKSGASSAACATHDASTRCA